MKLLRWLVPLLSLLAVVWLTWRDLRHGGAGPGPLHPAHAALSALAGSEHCAACHREGAGVDAAACLQCHTALAATVAAGTGLHGRMAAAVRQRCERCHSDHHGAEVQLIAPHAFARAGVADGNGYDHRDVAFTLTGTHATLACQACHRQADAPAPPPGGRFLGLSQRCTSCHDDVHRGAFGAECARCHAQDRPWRTLVGFTHTRFPLQGGHAQVGCVQCHPEGSPHAVAVAATAGDVRRCGDCHADPHGGGGAAPTALRLPNTADCTRCHAATTWRAARLDAQDHADLGFPLRGPHAGDRCASCHGDAAKPPRWRGDAAPAVAACAACHASPHRADMFAAAVAANGPADGCAGCHLDADADWAAGRLTAAQHRAAGMALEVPHADVACAQCHVGTTRAERYPGRAAEDCRACHRDAHAGQFAARPQAGQCSSCHAGAHWRPSTFGPHAHADTAFPLQGAHAAVACAACHRQGTDGVRSYHGTAVTCSACHADAHRGAFDRAGLPRSVDGRVGCARCHDANAFAPAATPFVHAAWTGHELVGAHAQLACAQCHPAVPGGPRLGPVAGTTCAACHRDPHAGQFDQGGVAVDCTRCHASTTWAELRFDHRQHSRFALDATHAALPCSKCHVAYPSEAGPIVRYKPLGTACSDCHRLPTRETPR